MPSPIIRLIGRATAGRVALDFTGMDGVGREGETSGSRGDGAGGRIPGYDGLERIGSGGSSTVYRAVDVRHQRSVAIKVLNLEASTGRRRTAFQREIEAIGRVGSHPYIVTVLGSGFTSDNHPYLVLPLFERGTFGRMIDEHGPLTWPDAVDVGIKLCSALETVHRAGVVHRDIKPGNVFVGVTPQHPLLADFGISSTIDGEPTRTQTMAVTFGYTAPEVLDDERPTPASDIYSLAMTIFRLIQGLHAYYADTPAAVVRKMLSDPDRPQLSAGVPTPVAAVVADGLARDPADRPASALELARRLQQVQADNGLAPTPVVVADEPAVAGVATPTREPEAATDGGFELEDTMVAAVRARQGAAVPVRRPQRTRSPSGPDDELGPRSAGAVARVDIGGILAAAMTETAGESAAADTPADSFEAAPDADPRSSSLDLPTIVTPRKPRDRIEDPVPAEPTAARNRWRIAVAVLVAVAVVVLGVLVYETQFDGVELAPIGNGFTGP